MKRLLNAMINNFGIIHPKGANIALMGRAIDFFRANGGNSVTANKDVTKFRWSTSQDVARLLQIMLGTPNARAKYIGSLQFMTRSRLDDKTRQSLKAEYWVSVASEYNDPRNEVEIDVGYDMVNLYLRSHLTSEYRTSWSATKLRENFRKLRAAYEGSQEYANYKRSGQNSDQFYPDFNDHNPSHVMLHYLERECPKGAVLGDLPDSVTVDTSATDTVDKDNFVDCTVSTPPTKRKFSDLMSPLSDSSTSVRSFRSSRSHSSRSLSSATATFSDACKTLMETIKQSQERERREREKSVPPRFDVLQDSDRVLRLIATKSKLKKALKTLKENGADEEDVACVVKQLTLVSEAIRSY